MATKMANNMKAEQRCPPKSPPPELEFEFSTFRCLVQYNLISGGSRTFRGGGWWTPTPKVGVLAYLLAENCMAPPRSATAHVCSI